MNFQNLKIAIRRIAQNFRLTLLIFVGLVIGLTSSLVIYVKVNHELSFDAFHTQSKNTFRVVRVTSGLDYLGGGFEYRAGIYFPFPGEFKKSIPEMRSVTSLFYAGGQKIGIPSKGNAEGKVFSMDDGVVFAESSFFDVFDFGKTRIKWLKGEGKQTLDRPFTAIITKETANKLFLDQEPIGQVMDVFGKTFTVTGVVSDFPVNTDFPFKVILSMVTFSESIAKDAFANWDGLSDIFQCYVVLKDKNEVPAVEQKIKNLHALHRHDEYVERRLFKLQPLSEVHKDSQFGNFNQHTVSGGLLLAISMVGIFIFLIAFFNYSNFFLAETFKQKKQIALKLILGSKPFSILYQFLTESLLVTFSALIVSLFFTFIILKNFYSFIDIPAGYTPEMGWSAVLFIFSLLFSGGILSVIFSFFNINLESLSNLLKKNDSGYTGRENVFGKWSVILQFVVAQAVIIATLFIVKQIYFINHQDLGYNTQNVMVVRLPGGAKSQINALSGELLADPKIKGVAFSSVTPSETNNFTNITMFRNNEKMTIDAELKSIDTSYINLYALKLMAGENLAATDTAFNIIVNKELITEIGFKTVDEAIGARVEGFRRNGATIKGVVNDFYSGSLHDKIRPVILMANPNGYSTMSIKLADSGGGNNFISDDIQKVKKVWNQLIPNQDFEYQFLSDRIDNFYNSEYKAMNLFLIFASVTIFLCILGILGLSLSMNEKRIKEIGIRKVNGATVTEILTLLNSDFVKWVAIAFVVAAPIAWYAMFKWLENFAYKTNLSWWIFALSAFIALVITLITVSWQSWKAAARNPVEALRYE